MSLKFNNSEDLRAAVAAETKEGLHRLVAALRDSDSDVKTRGQCRSGAHR
ncbi:hypothetical protein SAMN05444358_103331 [Ruegeria halocynthiae]|uniref:Uncharacterized protein n=1 Tax=Ruegeria halocynthiae TaxID=985054 RepID=A0A1H2ZSM4_9RHOB|nr:hypothetical protein SAMN05444358_103331 [Ruegeria halocynthiae]